MQTTGGHWNTLGTLQVVSFLVFCVLGSKKAHKCILRMPMPSLVPLHVHCDAISVKTMPPSGRAYPQEHSLEV